MRIIAHLDMDYFFAQIEERENPKLIGQPVVVGADPKEGRGRGVVSTANYEARRFGIHSALPISWAWRACPQAVFLRPRHDFYTQVSAKIRKIIEDSLKNIADAKIEQVSIDEFYLDLSGFKKLALSPSTSFGVNSVEGFCQDLKEKILKNEKLTCSIGLAPNKLLAKIASGFKKPRGLTVVEKKMIGEFLGSQNVEVLPGVGPKTASALHQKGIRTIADLGKISREMLHQMFGKWGENIWEASQGRDESAVTEVEERKTLGSQITFAQDTQNFYFLRRTLFDLSRQVWEQIQKEKLSPQMIEVTIRYFDFETHSHQKTLEEPLASLYQFRQEAERLLKDSLKPKLVRLLGVRVGKWQD